MKAHLYSILFLAGTFIANTALASGEPQVEKKKTFSKSYSVSGSEKISISNQFGEMKISTWDRNEVKVDVTITAKADDDARAQQILDHISIEDGKNGNGVYFKTKFDNDKKKSDKKSHRNEGMEINYSVSLPAGNPIDLENSFGSMIIPDHRGEATLESKFGSLKAGRISNAKLINVEFGQANIEEVNGGKLVIKFSSGSVNKLSGDVDANFEFCDPVKVNVDNSIKELDLRNSYSTVYLDVPRNLSANFDISTNFGDLSNSSAFAINKQGADDNNRGPRFTNKYTGTAGGGSSRVKIRSEFGKVVIGHDLKVDTNQKSKNKAKSKTTSI